VKSTWEAPSKTFQDFQKVCTDALDITQENGRQTRKARLKNPPNKFVAFAQRY
jgi:hypothetical protein